MTTAKCTGSDTPACANRAPATAPTIEPRLQKPWQRDMMRRPTSVSIRSASVFIATSTRAIDTPATNSAAASAGAEPTNAGSVNRSAQAGSIVRHASRSPSHSTARPATTSPTSEPSGIASRHSPSIESDSPSAALTSGMRGIQFPSTADSTKNTAKMARTDVGKGGVPGRRGGGARA